MTNTANPSRVPGRAAQTDAIASGYVIRRYDRAGWDENDQAELDAWLGESSANQTAFLRLKSAWLRANRLDALRSATLQHHPLREKGISHTSLKFAAVASLVALLGGAGWLFNQPEVKTFSTQIGQRSNLKLADGTLVELTTDTILRVAADRKYRKAWLDRGEAFFQVVHDNSRPFEVQALGFRIVDLGTQFSVRRDSNRIEVTVLKGSVELREKDSAKGKPSIRMTAGEVAIADKKSIIVRRKPLSELHDALGWRNGVLVFRYAPLDEVATEFNRYNTEKIVIDDHRASKLIISARLQATDVGAFARMAHDFLGLQVRRNGDEIHISH